MAVAARHRAGKLLLGGLDDLERADAARFSRTAGALGQQPDAGAVLRQPPVRRERHQAVAIGAGDCARPEVAFNADVVRLSRKNPLVLRFSPANELARHVVELCTQGRTVCPWPLDRRFEDQGGDWVQVIGDRRVAQPMDFDRDASAASGRIQNRLGRQRSSGNVFNPMTIVLSWRVRECTLVAVRIEAEVLLRSLGGVEPTTGRDRVAVNPEHVQKLLPVGVRRQQRREHGCTCGYQRPARPPHVEVVRWRQRCHGSAFSGAFLPDLGDRQPAFDQAGVRHRSVSCSLRRAAP